MIDIEPYNQKSTQFYPDNEVVYLSYNDDSYWNKERTHDENYFKIWRSLKLCVDNDYNIFDTLQYIRDSLEEPNNFILRVHLSFPITTMGEFMIFFQPGEYGLHYDPKTRSFFKTIYMNINLGKLDRYNEEYLFKKLSQCFDPITKSVVFRIFDKSFVKSYQIFVKTLTGKTITIEAENITSMYDLKKNISDNQDVPISVRLIFAGRSLERYDYLLLDYRIYKESLLHMVLNLRGGMHHPSSGHNDYSDKKTLEPIVPEVCVEPLRIMCPNLKLNEYFIITMSQYLDCSLSEVAMSVHKVGKYL